MQSVPMSLRLNSAIDEALAEDRLVGAVVLVSQDGQLVYQRAAGWADRERAMAMREDSIFRLASVTKPIISVTAMRLVELGVLALDTPVSRYLPDFRPRLVDGDETHITIHQLLSHTSGLGYRFLAAADSPYHLLGVSDGLDQPGLSLAENLTRIAEAPLLFAPGERWGYSLALDVLGAVIEAACGKCLQDVVHQHVSGPLGMSDTRFHVLDPVRLVKPYVDGATAPVEMTDGMSVALEIPGFQGAVCFAPSRILDERSYQSGGAGMAGTALDVMRMLEAIRQGGHPILKSETVARMMSDQVGSEAQTQGPGWGFGYGWAVLADPNLDGGPQAKGTIQWGGVYGHSWFVDPINRVSVVALTNTTFEGMSGRFPVAIRDAVYGRSAISAP